MDIIFQKTSLDDEISSMVNLLLLGNEHIRVKKYICEYFDLPIEIVSQRDKDALVEIITPVIMTEQVNNANVIDEKIKIIAALWDTNSEKINKIFCNVFESPQNTSVIEAFISVNCVCPYDFEKKRIYINYRKSGEEMLEACVHELIHYYWFDKWYKLFSKKYEQSIVWSFSEIAVDALFFETELKQYCVREYPAHKHFYEIDYNGQNMMEYFRNLYRDNSIVEFMRLGIEIIQNLDIEI